jgi:hypothetical protein
MTYLYKTTVTDINHLFMSAFCTSDWCLGASFFFLNLNFLLLIELGVEFVIIRVELAEFQINVHIMFVFHVWACKLQLRMKFAKDDYQ